MTVDGADSQYSWSIVQTKDRKCLLELSMYNVQRTYLKTKLGLARDLTALLSTKNPSKGREASLPAFHMYTFVWCKWEMGCLYHPAYTVLNISAWWLPSFFSVRLLTEKKKSLHYYMCPLGEVKNKFNIINEGEKKAKYLIFYLWYFFV